MSAAEAIAESVVRTDTADSVSLAKLHVHPVRCDATLRSLGAISRVECLRPSSQHVPRVLMPQIASVPNLICRIARLFR
jgi:hypothetical protein